MKLDITVMILTFNESLHIKRCIESVKDFCKDVVVVDSFSTDDTPLIVENLGARFVQNAWVNHAHQFNWALGNVDISTEWIIRIDADEYVEKPLELEITEVLKNVSTEVNGFYFRRKYFFLGQWISHGAMYPVNVLRMWRTGTGHIEQRWMDEHVVLEQGDTVHLKENIVDDNLNDVSWWTAKHNNYATLEMVELLSLKYQFIKDDKSNEQSVGGAAGIKRWVKQSVYARLPYFIRPLMYFLYRYFLKLGFLDGVKGFAYHFMQGYWYRSLVDLKILEAEGWIGQEQDAEKIKVILSEKTGLKL